MSSPKQPAVTTSINKTELPAFVEQGGQQNYEYAKEVADNLAAPYQGNLVADLNQDQTNAFDMVRDYAQWANPYMTQSAQSLGALSNYDPTNVSAQSWATADQSKYLNPFTQNVIDTTMAQMDQGRLNALRQTGDQAASAGAFGGSRQGVMEGVTNAQNLMNQAQLGAQLRQAGYQNAQQMFNSDADRALTADRSNQTADIEGAKIQSQAALQQAYAAQMGQNAAIQGAAALQAVGDTNRQYEQDLLNQQAAQYDAMRNYDLEKLGIRQSSLAMTPYGQTSTNTTTGTRQSSNNAGQIMSGVGSIASALVPLMMMSDERVKKNKSLLFKDPDTGVDLYAYNYITDKKGAKKTVGPLAQDLEKAGADVREVAGIKHAPTELVDTPTVRAAAAEFNLKVPRKSLLGGEGGSLGLPGLLDSDPAPTLKKSVDKTPKKIGKKKVSN